MIAIAALAFAMWVHVSIIDPGNVGWLLRGQDLGQNALGLAAYLRVGNWPGTQEALLLAPEGVPLLFTDSNPLLGLLLWPIAPWLSPGVQFVGLWLFTCLMLHVLFAALLVRRVAPDFLSLWLGTALLTLMPTLFNRIAHANLCAHWLILFAFWIFIDRDRARSARWWGLALGVAALVHPYLLLMVAAIWASAMLAVMAQRTDRPQPGWRWIAGQALVAGIVVAIVSLNGALGKHFASTGSFGAFPMAIDGIINPGNPSYAALLPSTPENHGRGFEGFQYLGAGLLLLLVAAVPILIATRKSPPIAAILPQGRWLIPALAAMTIFALGNQIWLHGMPILTIHLGQSWVDLLDPVRATGRFFWPTAYALAMMAVGAACRLGRWTTPLLGLALALQILDTAPMFAAIRSLTKDADAGIRYRRTSDPRWEALIAKAGAIEFQPAENFADLPLMQEISWRAMLACRPTRFTYASRLSREQTARIAEDRRAFQAARLDPGRLYVMLDAKAVPEVLRPRIATIDGVAVLPPMRAGTAELHCR